jgi:hypothetical protein
MHQYVVHLADQHIVRAVARIKSTQHRAKLIQTQADNKLALLAESPVYRLRGAILGSVAGNDNRYGS